MFVWQYYLSICPYSYPYAGSFTCGVQLAADVNLLEHRVEPCGRAHGDHKSAEAQGTLRV